MKKIVLGTVMLISVSVFAQQNKVVSAYNYLRYYLQDKKYDDLQKAKTAIDEATVNEETKDKAKTFLYRGNIYMALFDYTRADAINKSAETEEGKKKYAAYRAMDMKEADEAFTAYKKTLELDSKKTYTDEVMAQIRVIYSDYMDKFNSELNGKMYADAMPAYEKAGAINLAFFPTKIDTGSFYNYGYCAQKAKDYAKATMVFGKLSEMKFMKHKSNLALIGIYNEMGDTANAKKQIDIAKKVYPGNLDVIIEEINYFLKADRAPEAITSLEDGLKADPNNAELHLILGQTFNKMAFPKDAAGKDLPKPVKYDEYIKNAENHLLKAIELKPNYTNAQYTLGHFYSNQGAMIYNAAQKLTDLQAISKKEKEADAYFMKAIPYLEKALELDPTDKDTMKALKQLYLKTNQADTDKYKKVDAMLKG